MRTKSIHYAVIGIEYGMDKASKVSVLGTFSTVEKAESFIKIKNYSSIYTLVDIIETYIDNYDNKELESSIQL